jgi:small conductance mechanosensitive channel
MALGNFTLSHVFVMSVIATTIRIALIIIAIIIVLRLAGTVVDRLFLPGAEGKKYYFEEKRAKTLIALLKSMLKYVMYFIAGIMILKEFNIDTTSILAGAGIIGLAVGVGAQSMVRDIITGFFIIFEDQFSVGDYITTAELSGLVEEIGLRVIKLRDLNGVLHIIPNGTISKVTNFTRGTMQATVNIPVAYEADKDKAWQAVEEAVAEIQQEMVEIIEGPKIVGYMDFSPRGTVLRVIARVVPLEQVKVETALRHRIIQKFGARDISFMTKQVDQ